MTERRKDKTQSPIAPVHRLWSLKHHGSLRTLVSAGISFQKQYKGCETQSCILIYLSSTHMHTHIHTQREREIAQIQSCTPTQTIELNNTHNSFIIITVLIFQSTAQTAINQSSLYQVPQIFVLQCLVNPMICQWP